MQIGALRITSHNNLQKDWQTYCFQLHLRYGRRGYFSGRLPFTTCSYHNR
jgi:hypothetical protein